MNFQLNGPLDRWRCTWRLANYETNGQQLKSFFGPDKGLLDCHKVPTSAAWGTRINFSSKQASWWCNLCVSSCRVRWIEWNSKTWGNFVSKWRHFFHGNVWNGAPGTRRWVSPAHLGTSDWPSKKNSNGKERRRSLIGSIDLNIQIYGNELWWCLAFPFNWHVHHLVIKFNCNIKSKNIKINSIKSS